MKIRKRISCCILFFAVFSFFMSAHATTMLQRPKDMDDGYWVDAYRYYMENISAYKGYAVLADFDLDGAPELLALDEQWPHAGVDGCFVKYTGSNYVVYEEYGIFLEDDTLYLTQENGGYAWYMSSSYAGTGLYCTSVSRLSFSERMQISENKWFELSGNMDKGTEEYSIGSRNVSKREYDQEEAKWNSITKLFTLVPADYPYPRAWDNAVNQYSVTSQSKKSQSTSNDSYVKGTSGKSHLRLGPGLGYDDVGVLHVGETATFLNETSTDERGVVWYKVSFDGKTCWVSSKYTTLYNDSGASGADNSGFIAKSYVKGTSGKSHLRLGPGLGYDDVGVFHVGETATFLNETSTDERGVVWYKVSFGGKTCWVSSKYTTLYSESGASRTDNSGYVAKQSYPRGLVNEPENPSYYVPSFYDVYLGYRSTDNNSPSTSNAGTENWTIATRLVSAGGDFYRVANCNEWISARTEADTNAEVLQRFYLGEIVWVVGTWREWSLCVCDNYHEDNYVCGWALSKYLNYVGYGYQDEYMDKISGGNQENTNFVGDDFDYEGSWDPGQPLGSLIVANSDQWVEMYIHSSNLSEIIAYVPPGATVTDCYDVGDGYILCNYEGETGFIRGEYLNMK